MRISIDPCDPGRRLYDRARVRGLIPEVAVDGEVRGPVITADSTEGFVDEPHMRPDGTPSSIGDRLVVTRRRGVVRIRWIPIPGWRDPYLDE